MKHLLHILSLSLSLSLLPLSAQNVSKVEVQQQGDRLFISYTLDKEADIYLSATLDGRYLFCRSVSGDVGTNVSAGRNTITWDVLSDVEEFVGQAVFQVHASPSTRSEQALQAKQQKEANRQSRLEGIYPLAGFDLSGGFYGMGGAIYWPWVTGKPSRVGSYLSYVCGMQDWKNEDVDMFHNICLGVTCTVSKHVALFAAPGLSIVQTKGSSVSYYSDGREYRASDYASNTYKFAIEGGICFKVLVFTLSAKYAYPSYLGFGVGLDFGWL